MIVYLWDADGPASGARGVTDDPARAQEAAEACLTNGQATAARVEKTNLVTGIRALNPGYTRLGHGWTAQPRRKGRIRWVPLRGSPELTDRNYRRKTLTNHVRETDMVGVWHRNLR